MTLDCLKFQNLPKRKWHGLLIYIKSSILLDIKSGNSSVQQAQSFFIDEQVSTINYCPAELLCLSCLPTACDTFFNLKEVGKKSRKLRVLQCVVFLGLKQKLSSNFRQSSYQKIKLLAFLFNQSLRRCFTTLCIDSVALLSPLLLYHRLCI